MVSLVSRSLDAAFIEVSGVLNSCASSIEHGRAQFAALARRLGAGRRFLPARPFQPDRRKVRDRLQHCVAQVGAMQREASDRRSAEPDGRDHESRRLAQ